MFENRAPLLSFRDYVQFVVGDSPRPFDAESRLSHGSSVFFVFVFCVGSSSPVFNYFENSPDSVAVFRMVGVTSCTLSSMSVYQYKLLSHLTTYLMTSSFLLCWKGPLSSWVGNVLVVHPYLVRVVSQSILLWFLLAPVLQLLVVWLCRLFSEVSSYLYCVSLSSTRSIYSSRSSCLPVVQASRWFSFSPFLSVCFWSSSLFHVDFLQVLDSFLVPLSLRIVFFRLLSSTSCWSLLF